MSETCKKYFFDGAISGKMSVVLGEKIQCLDYLCCVLKLLQALGMNVSAQECHCVNTAVNKMARGLINDLLYSLLELGQEPVGRTAPGLQLHGLACLLAGNFMASALASFRCCSLLWLWTCCGVLGKGHCDPASGSVGTRCLGRALHCLGPVAFGKPTKLNLNTRLGKGDNQAPSLDKPSIICSESALSHTVPGPSWWNSGDQSSRLTSKAG